MFLDLTNLLKPRLSLAIAAAGAAGYLLRAGVFAPDAGLLCIALLAISAGAGCLNNWQDRDRDRFCTRTRQRPLPAGRLSPRFALGGAVILLATGFAALLAAPFGWRTTAVAAVALLCYNALYTPLKTRTLWAFLPGMACGALPPLIGWLAAGGSAREPAAWCLPAILGLWQPPHVWLILLTRAADERPDHGPLLLRAFSRTQGARIMLCWTTALGVSLMALPLLAGLWSPCLLALEWLAAVILTGAFGLALVRQTDRRILCAGLNSVVLAGVALVLCERLYGWL